MRRQHLQRVDAERYVGTTSLYSSLKCQDVFKLQLFYWSYSSFHIGKSPRTICAFKAGTNILIFAAKARVVAISGCPAWIVMCRRKAILNVFYQWRLCFEKISLAFRPCLSLFNLDLSLMPSHSERLQHFFLVNLRAKLAWEHCRPVSLITNLPWSSSPGCPVVVLLTVKAVTSRVLHLPWCHPPDQPPGSPGKSLPVYPLRGRESTER